MIDEFEEMYANRQVDIAECHRILQTYCDRDATEVVSRLYDCFRDMLIDEILEIVVEAARLK